jgi:hypothetical protein
MRLEGRRRGGWDYDAAPIAEPTRSEIHDRDARRAPSIPHLGAGLLTIFIAMLMIVGCIVAFRVIDFKRISSSEMTPLPAIHNSPDTKCNDREQCTDEEFAGLVESLRRQWTITPEELRSKCAGHATYPSVEHCILEGTVSWFEKHPKGEAPWINPKNFDAAIMALCQKDPKSPLCLEP